MRQTRFEVGGHLLSNSPPRRPRESLDLLRIGVNGLGVPALTTKVAHAPRSLRAPKAVNEQIERGVGFGPSSSQPVFWCFENRGLTVPAAAR